jgi:hypothetical protein
VTFRASVKVREMASVRVRVELLVSLLVREMASVRVRVEPPVGVLVRVREMASAR